MALKVIYFTAGMTPTPEELGEIAVLNQYTSAPLAVNVSNGSVLPNLGQRPPAGEEVGPQPILEAADMVWGTVPDAYSDYEVFDPESPPLPPLPDDKAVVGNGDELQLYVGSDVPATGPVTALVEDGEVAHVALDGTIGVVMNGQPFTLGGQTFTPTVVNGAITAIDVQEA